MCGIFGIISYGANTFLKAQAFRDLTRSLMEGSQIRGNDASGLCVTTESKIRVFKDKVPASMLIQGEGYSNVLKLMSTGSAFRSMLGHTRAETKGDHKFNVNNHPILAETVVGVHNGMINNDDALFSKYADKIKRAGRVDSEIIFRLIDMYLSDGKDIAEAIKTACEELRGSFACAVVTSRSPRYLTLFRNSMSTIVLYSIPIAQVMVFASTDYILGKALEKQAAGIGNAFVEKKMTIPENSGVRIDTYTGHMYRFSFDSPRHRSVGAWYQQANRCPFDGCKEYCGNSSCKDCVYEIGISVYGGMC